jgi:hypothetical protein
MNNDVEVGLDASDDDDDDSSDTIGERDVKVEEDQDADMDVADDVDQWL